MGPFLNAIQGPVCCQIFKAKAECTTLPPCNSHSSRNHWHTRVRHANSALETKHKNLTRVTCGPKLGAVSPIQHRGKRDTVQRGGTREKSHMNTK